MDLRFQCLEKHFEKIIDECDSPGIDANKSQDKDKPQKDRDAHSESIIIPIAKNLHRNPTYEDDSKDENSLLDELVRHGD